MMRPLFFPSSRPRFINSKEIISELSALASHVTKKMKNVEAVYLFGSFSRNQAAFRSDADILVILSRDERSPLDRLDEFIMEFANGPLPIDVLVYTKDEIEFALKQGNRFLAAAMRGIRLA